jgi:hypothetical protein
VIIINTGALYSVLMSGMIIGQAIFWAFATSFVVIYGKRGICKLWRIFHGEDQKDVGET